MPDRPLLLDLFSGSGGCAAGYTLAGFQVIGIDHRPMPRYLQSGAIGFVQTDALHILRWLLDGHGFGLNDPGPFNVGRHWNMSDFAVIHASPPCQAYSAANNIHGRKDHPDLIGPVRDLLRQTGKPYVIENVPRSPLQGAVQICGLALGLNVRRHRWFESNLLLFGTECGDHTADYAIVFGGGARGRSHQTGRAKGGGPVIHRPTLSLDKAKAAMGIDWMTRDELSQSVPPAYTRHLGRQLLSIISNGVAL